MQLVALLILIAENSFRLSDRPWAACISLMQLTPYMLFQLSCGRLCSMLL